jgi:hypothetical protein
MLLSVVSALQSAAVDLERSSGGFDPGVMDADGAYSLTLNIVAEALRGISSKLQIDAQRDAAGNEEAVERRVVESDIAHSANLEGPREALDSWVAGQLQINVTDIQNAEVVSLLRDGCGYLVVKLPRIPHQLVVRNDP